MLCYGNKPPIKLLLVKVRWLIKHKHKTRTKKKPLSPNKKTKGLNYNNNAQGLNYDNNTQIPNIRNGQTLPFTRVMLKLPCLTPCYHKSAQVAPLDDMTSMHMMFTFPSHLVYICSKYLEFNIFISFDMFPSKSIGYTNQFT